MILKQLLAHGEELLTQAGVPEGRLNAWYLFSYVTEMSKSEYFLRSDEQVRDEWQEEYENVLKQRLKRKPLEYITHKTEFMGLPFYVDENVLIPRQDTECLVEAILPLAKGSDVLDLCTGSGCIGISLGVLASCQSLTLADLSQGALDVAERNRNLNQVEATLVQGDLFENISGVFDLIVSNPPYIPSKEVKTLMPEVRDYEPNMALDGDEDGLYFYRRIIKESKPYLKNGGWLCFEIGCDQGESVSGLMKEAGFTQVVIKKDLAGLDRIVQGCRMEE